MPPELKTTAQYRDLVKEFQPDSGHLLACLHKVHHLFGYIPPAAVPAIAQQLKMSPAAVFGSITFYTEFRTSPPPQVDIHWCSGPACRLRGGDNIRRALEAVLGVGIDETTKGNVAGIHIQQCDGSCEYAPLVWLRRAGTHADGPDAALVADRGEVRGPLRVADAVAMARRLKAGDVNV
jgi:NADH:ubiquinone oxidoreductase subunit E